MEIKINLGKIIEYGLSLNDYGVLCLIHTDNLKTYNINFENSLERLRKKGIINYRNEIVSELPDDFFGDNEKISNITHFWEEFKNTYPKKDGPRRLHDSPSKCEEKYLRYIRRDITLHKKVMKGLETENKLRDSANKRNEFFQAPKLMSTYLNNKSWEGYLDDESESDNLPSNRKII